MASIEHAARLAPEQRRAQILLAARACVAAEGTAAFSLESVAREAGVAASLPRHYFGSRDGLLIAVAESGLGEVLDVLLAPRETATLRDRFGAYLDIVRGDPWIHSMWLHADEIHPKIGALVGAARRRMAEFSVGAEWGDLSPRAQFIAAGFVGYVEAVVTEWIDQGGANRAPALDAIVQASRSLGVGGALPK